MRLQHHVVLGGGAAVALSPVLGVRGSGIFFLASVLIDVDHYWNYLWRNGFTDWSFRRTFAFHEVMFPRHVARAAFLGLDLFHTVEWLVLVAGVGIWLGSAAVLAALWGMVFHLVLDLVRLARHRMVFKRALSLVEYSIRRRALVRAGLDPDQVYRDALREIGVGTRWSVPAAEG